MLDQEHENNYYIHCHRPDSARLHQEPFLHGEIDKLTTSLASKIFGFKREQIPHPCLYAFGRSAYIDAKCLTILVDQ